MALIAMAADKGAPGVTTSAIALAAVWPRPVLLAECDPAGGDLACRLRAAGPGGRLDPRRGVLSLAVAARRGIRPEHVWEHAQKLHGGLDVLLGTANAEQGSGLDPLWAAVGVALAALPDADVIADCGRIGADGPFYDLLAHAAAVVLVTRPSLAEVLRLRDRAAAVVQAVGRRTGRTVRVGVLVVADRRQLRAALGEVAQAVAREGGPVTVLGGIAFEPATAEALRGEWGGKLDRSLLIRTAREVAGQLAGPWWRPEPARPAPPRGGRAGPARHAAAGRTPSGPAPGSSGRRGTQRSRPPWDEPAGPTTHYRLSRYADAVAFPGAVAPAGPAVPPGAGAAAGMPAARGGC
jgi:hypothetical protein